MEGAVEGCVLHTPKNCLVVSCCRVEVKIVVVDFVGQKEQLLKK
jgi:hypothetical protein